MQASQLHVPPLTRINKTIIIASVAVFVLNSLLAMNDMALSPYLGLSNAMLSKGHIYQLITYPFVAQGLMGLIFECLLLWFLGSELESIWGERTYILFLISSSLTAAIIYLTLGLLQVGSFASYPLMGLAGLGYSMCLAYAIMFSDRYLTFMLIFPMKAKWFCAIMVGILLYSGVFSAAGATSWAHLAAMAGGLGFLRYKAYQKSSSKDPRSAKRLKKASSSHLYIVKDDDEGPPTYH
jgi:membrane associated rhomboid family serine protease